MPADEEVFGTCMVAFDTIHPRGIRGGEYQLGELGVWGFVGKGPQNASTGLGGGIQEKGQIPVKDLALWFADGLTALLPASASRGAPDP